MLSRFEVSNFKNFGSRFVFDLSSPKNYEFNRECVCATFHNDCGESASEVSL